MQASETVAISGSFKYKVYYITSLVSGGLLHDCISNIINDAAFMNLSYTIKSTILWNDVLGTDPPSAISTYITAHPTNDYVIEGAANWNYLWLGRLDSFTTSKEENIEMSLKDLMDILKLKMRLWWFIDEDGYFRIEHERYFREYTSQTDLTSATYAVDKPEVDQKIYNYALNEAVSQITYGESNQLNADWIAPDVSFPVLSTSENTKEVKISQLTTDLANAINDSSISSSGIILLKCKPMGAFNYLVDLDQSTKDPTVYIVNARLGWHYLINNYFKYFAEAGAGTIDGSAFTYTHVKEYLKQNKIKFRKSTSLLWYKPLNVSKGIGWIEDAEYDVESGMYSVNVGINANYNFSDWYLPSKDEAVLLYTNLKAYGVGGLSVISLWTSSESSATSSWILHLTDGTMVGANKTTNTYSRAIRSFTTSDIYNLRDIGPSGGWIYHIIDNGNGTYTYLECAPVNTAIGHWSNITNVAIGTTGTAIGDGQSNTLEIIGQAGHTASAAKLCNDLVIAHP
jgi:hypothetical protein